LELNPFRGARIDLADPINAGPNQADPIRRGTIPRHRNACTCADNGYYGIGVDGSY
jgi:hypothetical protein